VTQAIANASAEERELLEQLQAQNRNTEQLVTSLHRRMDDSERPRAGVEPERPTWSQATRQNILSATILLRQSITSEARSVLIHCFVTLTNIFLIFGSFIVYYWIINILFLIFSILFLSRCFFVFLFFIFFRF
jgi:hypothetical protein